MLEDDYVSSSADDIEDILARVVRAGLYIKSHLALMYDH